MSARLKAAIDALEAGRAELAAVLVEDYPIGGRIAWRYHTGEVQRGIVLDHGYQRIRVANLRTGSERWLSSMTVIIAAYDADRLEAEAINEKMGRAAA